MHESRKISLIRKINKIEIQKRISHFLKLILAKILKPNL
jgi:hypothetical protein